MTKLVVLEISALIIVAVSFTVFLSLGGWDSTPAPLVSSFNDSFWDLNQIYPSLNTTIFSTSNMTTNSAFIELFNLTYYSHFINGTPVIINAAILKPNGTALPAMLLLHGTNGSLEDVLPFGVELASRGYVVMAIDSPGCGESTGPSCNATNIVDFTNGPLSSYYYHNTLAASRAITVLTTMPFVNSSLIGVSGASMGGITTFWLASIDERVKVAVPIAASGYFDEVAKRGSLVNYIIPSNVKLTDPDAIDLIRYFDCRTYASNTTVPTLMLIGTNDEFFFIEAVNKTFNAISSDKSLNLAPNTGHAWAGSYWLESADIWLSHYLKGQNATLPSIPVTSVESVNFYSGLKVTLSNVDSNLSYVVIYRDGMPGSRWNELELAKSNTISLTPLPTTYQYYIAVRTGNVTLATSPVYSIQVTPALFIISFTLLFAVTLLLAYNWREEISAYASTGLLGSVLFILSLAIWIVAVFSLSLPWIELPGKTSISLLQFWDRFALQIPPFTAVLVAMIIPLVAYVVRIWLGGIAMAVSFLVIYSYLMPMISSNGIILGWGAYILGICVAISLLVPAILKLVRL